MQDMIALRKQRYGKRNLVAGDRFPVSQSHVAVMEIAGLARVAHPVVVEPPRAPRVYVRKEPVADPEAFEAQEEPKPKRTYQRKDMTAEPASE